jgi:hypothetical protein
MERGAMDGGDHDFGDFLQSAYCCVSLHPPVDCINWLKVFVAGKGYHMGITTNIYVK